MRATLVSFFSSQNLGDLLIAQTLVDMVSGLVDVVPISFGTGLAPTQGMSIAPVSAHGEKLAQRLLGAHPDLATLLARRNKWSETALETVADSDLLIIGGGNMLFDVSRLGRSAAEFGSLIRQTKDMGKPVLAPALGIGPFATVGQRAAAVDALMQCDYVSFRDERSLSLFRQGAPHVDAELSADPVFRLPTLSRPLAQGANSIAVNFMDTRLAGFSSSDYTRHLDTFGAWVRRLRRETDAQIELFSTESQDYVAISELSARTGAEICEVRSLDDLLTLYRRSSLVLAFRMHALIIATTQLVPVVGIGWQPKIESFFELIQDIDGMIPLAHDQGDRMVRACLRRLQPDEARLAVLTTVLSQLRERSEKDVLHLERMLS